MKKLLSILCLTAALSGTAYSEGLNIKIGGSVYQGIYNTSSLNTTVAGVSTGRYTVSESTYADPGYSIDISYDFKISQTLEWGIGASYTSELVTDDPATFLMDNYEFLPIYLQMKIGVNNEEYINPYAVIRGGISLFKFNGNPEDYGEIVQENGYYCAVGAGVDIGNLILEATYELMSGYYEVDTGNFYNSAHNYYYSVNGSMDVLYTKLTFKVGMNFGRGY